MGILHTVVVVIVVVEVVVLSSSSGRSSDRCSGSQACRKPGNAGTCSQAALTLLAGSFLV